MRRSFLTGLTLAMVWLTAFAAPPALAQQRSQLGPLCTTDTTPADKQIDACNKIIALKVFSGAKAGGRLFLARRRLEQETGTINTRVIADATEAIRLNPAAAGLYNLRGSAYYDKGEFDIAIADFNDALRLSGPHTTILHNRANAWRGKGDYRVRLPTIPRPCGSIPKNAFSFQNRGIVKLALGDFDGALVDLNNEGDPAQPHARVDLHQPRRAVSGEGDNRDRRDHYEDNNEELDAGAIQRPPITRTTGSSCDF